MVSVDFRSNDQANANIMLTEYQCAEWHGNYQQVETQVERHLNGHKAKAIICVAGGWAGGTFFILINKIQASVKAT